MNIKQIFHILKLICLCTLPILGACTSDDRPETGEETDSPISFQSTVKGSRALIDSEYAMIDSVGAFKVWGWRTPVDGSILNVFQGEKVYFNGTYWDYDNLRYWANQSIYDFFALYPYDLPEASCSTDGKLSFGLLDMRQSNEYNSALSVDLLRAEARGLVGSATSEAVYLQFAHMLTKLNFSFKIDARNQGDQMEVTYVLLNGMNCVGRMENGEWVLSEPSYYWDRLEKPQYLNTLDYATCFKDILVFPQTIEEKQITLYVVYNYTIEGGSPVTKVLETTLPVNLVNRWEAGSEINYTGEIHVDNTMTFDTPQVESWGTEQVGGTVVIK